MEEILTLLLDGTRYESPHDYSVDYDTLESFYGAIKKLDKFMGDEETTYIYLSRLLLYVEADINGEILLISFNHLERRDDVWFHAKYENKQIQLYYGKERLVFPERCEIPETNGFYLEDDGILGDQTEDLVGEDHIQFFFKDDQISYHRPGNTKHFAAKYSVWITDEKDGKYNLVIQAPHQTKFIPKIYRGVPVVRSYEL